MTPTKKETESLQGSGFKKIDLADDSRATLSQTRRRRIASLDLAEYVEHFRARVLQDALTEALRSTWLRRAEAFEAARHRPGIDFPGTATVEQLRAKWLELTEKSAGCRNHARICIFQDHEMICEHLKDAS